MDLEEVIDFIGENLHELAWHKDYPLVPNIGLECFLRAMRETGFIVDQTSRPFKFFDTFQHREMIWTPNAQMSEQEVVSGWGNYPKACPRAFYHSMYAVIDKMHEQIKSDFPKWKVPGDLSDALFQDRADKAHKALRRMELHFLDYFERCQEGALARVGSNDPQLHYPIILQTLLRRDVINFDRINSALAATQFQGIVLTNIRDTLDFLRNGREIGDGDHIGISQSGALDYIWGTYLLELARLKGYPVKDYEFNGDHKFEMLEKACGVGWNILEKVR